LENVPAACVGRTVSIDLVVSTLPGDVIGISCSGNPVVGLGPFSSSDIDSIAFSIDLRDMFALVRDIFADSIGSCYLRKTFHVNRVRESKVSGLTRGFRYDVRYNVVITKTCHINGYGAD
jgi:hypothetical protein